jgi:(p)ppGpp synthase/HD superfamily hydrolase
MSEVVPDRSKIILNKAMWLAVEAHTMQFRKGRDGKSHSGPNYIVHCAEVVAQLWEWGFDADRYPDILALAWLHDSVEDEGITYDQISTDPDLGAVLANRVCQMTFQSESKNAYLSTFLDSNKTDIESLIVKIADRICNVRNFLITDRDVAEKQRYARKYFAKGMPIFEAMESRKVEIIKRVCQEMESQGNDSYAHATTVYARIQDSVASMDSMFFPK